MLLSDCLTEFIKYQRLKGNSKSTINNYSLIIKKFIEFTGNIDLFDLSADHFNNYNLYVSDLVNKVSTRTYIRHLKVFVTFLVEKYNISDFRSAVVMPNKPHNFVDILSPAEINLLLQVDNRSTFIGMRNYCILLLMVDCGLRAGEIISCCVDDIQFDLHCIKVTGKGDKSRIVPLGAVVCDALSFYITKYNISSRLFIGNRYNFITADCLKYNFIRYKKITGITRLYPHLLRHTFATNFLLNGFGDVYELSMILGHSDIRTTEIYLNIANYYKFMQHKKQYSYIDKVAPLDYKN